MVRYIEKIKADGSKLEPLSPLAPPYSVIELGNVTERVSPQYGYTIAMEACVSCGPWEIEIECYSVVIVVRLIMYSVQV